MFSQLAYGAAILAALFFGSTIYYRAQYYDALQDHQTYVAKIEAYNEFTKKDNERKAESMQRILDSTMENAIYELETLNSYSADLSKRLQDSNSRAVRMSAVQEAPRISAGKEQQSEPVHFGQRAKERGSDQESLDCAKTTALYNACVGAWNDLCLVHGCE